MVRLFGLNISRNKSNYPAGLTQEGRDLGVEVRRMNYEARKKEHEIEMAEKEARLLEVKAAIRELREENGDEDGDMGDKLLGMIMAKVLGGNVVADVVPPPSTEKPSFDDASIEDMISKIPKKQLEIAAKLSDETLFKILKTKMGLDDATAKRGIEIFRAKNL